MTNRFLSTVGSWSTYRDLKSFDQVPERLEQVTTAFFGLSGLAAMLRGEAGLSPRQVLVGSVLTAMLAVHTTELATGALATGALKLAGRGQPVAKYRNMIIRRSPFTNPRARQLNAVSGGRLLEAQGYYFHDRGRTWHAQSFTFRVKGAPRTLTRVNSLGVPAREYYFDRPLALQADDARQVGEDGEMRSVYLQRLIDVIRGDESPESVPGYIGATNDLENAARLGDLKRALFVANWFLVDESERDDPAGNSDFVDYDAVLRGQSRQTSSPGYYQVGQSSPWTPPPRPIWPSVSAARPANPYTDLAAKAAAANNPPATIAGQARPIPGVARQSASQPANRPTQTSLGGGQLPDPTRIKNRWQRPDGQAYPILIETVITHPITQTRKAKNAFYHDGEGWRQITDEPELIALAAAYDRGDQTTIDEGSEL